MAIRGVVGGTLRSNFSHVDAAMNPISGETWEVLVATKPDDSLFYPLIREVGDGVYEVSIKTDVSDPPGHWYLLIEAGNGYRYEQTFELVGRRQTVVEVPATPQAGATRAQIRSAVASQMGDLVSVVATDDGTEAMVIDAINLDREVNAFNGMQVLCVDAQAEANIGMLSTVASSNPEARSINFNPEFPYITKAGDVFELYNYRDNGWRYDEYNQAINDAIMRGGEENARVPISTVLDTTFNRSFNLIEIPLPFTYFSGIDIIGRSGVPRRVPPSHYHVDKHTCEVTLRGRYITEAHGKRVRLRGERAPDILGTDDSRTPIPTEWVVAEAIAILLQADVTHGVQQGSRDRVLNMQRSGADGRRPSIVSTASPNTVKLMRGVQWSA